MNLNLEKRMKNRMTITGSLVLAMTLAIGCAGAPKKVYFSQPEVQVASNEVFTARIKPIKLDNPYYVGFELAIENKTTGAISIDWERTRYINNGKDQGRFAYKGIKAEEIKSAMPVESIPSSQILTKRIFPIKTIGFMRKRDVPKPGQSNFFPGILPNGMNSVVLVVRMAERQLREKLSMRFASKQIP
jgi:hypothetical protein